jgi:hypothetical protein
MKKIILLFSIISIAVGVNAQVNPWSGFFTPVKKVYPKVEQEKFLKSNFDTQTSNDSTVWLFRPIANVTALAISFNGGAAVTSPLSAIGTGISYAKFIPVNGQPYSQVAVNALILTNISLSSNQLTAIGGALTVSVWNNLFGIGIGYINNKAIALVNIGISL